jgi:hypothetical protein
MMWLFRFVQALGRIIYLERLTEGARVDTQRGRGAAVGIDRVFGKREEAGSYFSQWEGSEGEDVTIPLLLQEEANY